MKHALPYTLIAMLLFISSCSMHEDSEYIQTADSLLWANPDSCLLYIAEHKEELSSKDMPRMELIYQHATYKMSLYYGNDSLLQDMAEAFIRKSDYRSAGEAKYIQGANLVQQGKHFEATIALKEAETLFNRTSNVRLILKGMLYCSNRTKPIL